MDSYRTDSFIIYFLEKCVLNKSVQMIVQKSASIDLWRRQKL